MAKNIFSMFQGYVPKPKRNVFDLSFNNNFTTKFGQLTPVLCKEVIPGDSFKIETAAGLRLMPMAFPVQTPMKAYVHYFYVRNRALWKDWQDFITGTKSGLVPPYIDVANLTSDQKKEFFKIGGIADYFGVPNVYYGEYGSKVEIEVSHPNGDLILKDAYIDAETSIKVAYFNTEGYLNPLYFPYRTLDISDLSLGDVNYDLIGSIPTGTGINDVFTTQIYEPTSDSPSTAVLACQCYCKFSATYKSNLSVFVNNVYPAALLTPQTFIVLVFDENGGFYGKHYVEDVIPTFETLTNANTTEQLKPRYEIPIDSNWLPWQGGYQCLICGYTDKVQYANTYYYNCFQAASSSFIDDDPYFMLSSNGGAGYGSFSLSDFDDTPYDSDIQLNALPFRAYECIYNSYYRNMQNNPYILNGVEEYNKFIPSNEGGADTNEYKLHQRNWEYDFMTSAVPSPQFGIAPLVGITMTGTATFQDENGTTYYAQAEYDDDGTITGWSTHSSNMPAGTLRMLMDSVGTGISINDLRNVNSFQRFLENSLRVGLKYRDQIKGHFGVDVRYDELEMPEFIGGMSLDINVNQVTQTADVQDSSYPLAGFAGQAGAFGSSKHSVTKYCDEHGFIIGILSVVPVPVYSQLLPKFFTKNEQLDYFFPEFGHIGYQPILQKEVSPLQSYYAGDDLNGVFGYQRAWYDYIASTDEVHSQFRTTLKDFVMNRTYDESPALNEDFLLVDPDQVNDVFLVTSDGEYGPESDKILGQLYFKITKKSPIPMLGIPRLTD